jgi:hypothetical protein
VTPEAVELSEVAPSVDASGPPPGAAGDGAGRVSVDPVPGASGEASLDESAGARAGVVAAGAATGVGVLGAGVASLDWLGAGAALAGFVAFAGLAPWPPAGAWPWGLAVVVG